MRKARHASRPRENMMVLLYPTLPESSPERMTESPYPAERNVKMALAFAWLTANSSSTRGRIGEKTMRMEKLTNQTKSRKKRKARALPRNSSNRAIHSM
ncbi:MAG: hypothetical protein A4E61_00946 [Syntrophorhabdus sp. PtaB.Bin184]|nr:MAG: hypothetical protein A4E61_00946 [Syntrophorhabdus sp. PtaB.Bin184]